MATKRRDLGSLSPRLLELMAKTVTVEPYKISENVFIRQTRQRRDDLHAAYTEGTDATTELQKLIAKARALPEPPADDTDAVAAYQSQLSAMDKRAEELSTIIRAASERHTRAFWADAYDDVMELSADWEPEFYDAVKTDVNDHFMAGVNAPPDGRDEDSAIVDAAEAVEAGK